MSKRVQYFFSHLSISILVGLLWTAVVFLIWYPAPLMKAVGVLPLFIMMLVIDIIIGPFLSLLVYKEGKKTLKMDLIVVVVLQLCAFVYGIYSIAQGRPVAIVQENNYFMLVKKSDIIDKSSWQPSWTSVKFVSIPNSQSNELFPGLNNQRGSKARNPNYYQPLEKNQLSGLPFMVLEKYNDKSLVKAVLSQHPDADSWIGMGASHYNMVVLINEKDNKVVKVVDLRPW